MTTTGSCSDCLRCDCRCFCSPTNSSSTSSPTSSTEIVHRGDDLALATPIAYPSVIARPSDGLGASSSAASPPPPTARTPSPPPSWLLSVLPSLIAARGAVSRTRRDRHPSASYLAANAGPASASRRASGPSSAASPCRSLFPAASTGRVVATDDASASARAKTSGTLSPTTIDVGDPLASSRMRRRCRRPSASPTDRAPTIAFRHSRGRHGGRTLRRDGQAPLSSSPRPRRVPRSTRACCRRSRRTGMRVAKQALTNFTRK